MLAERTTSNADAPIALPSAYDGRRVSYATDAEMATALADLERRIAAARDGRVTQVRINSTKGV